MKEYSRTDRVGDQIQKELAQIIQREVRDPRLASTTITAVQTSKDMRYAKIYVTFMGVDDAVIIKEDITALNKAKGFFRTHLGKAMSLRLVPELSFIYDESIVRGDVLSRLIDKAISSDKENHTDDPEESLPE
ncbi:MAG: ribosome-binding factor A [Gammaproteobacteria bacterium CG22_combo_CG10-13_8_21_14_all_40_8]|nr:MAG: ribosome-binding factor A [Gammaproteobacteria bacterium CG22_combo_CG10-13_8_21_14_all_40_8]